MDVSSPRPSQRRPATGAQCEGPSGPMQPSCEDYHSDDSNTGTGRHDEFANVAAKRSYSSATKIVNFKPDEDSGYSSYSASTMPSADSSYMFNDAKSISASSKYSKDSGYHSDPDAIHPGISSRLNFPPSQAVKRRPAIRHDGEIIRTRVDASAPLSLSFNGEMEGKTLEIIPAEDGMVEVVVGGPRRENSYSLSPRKPLQRSGSNPSGQSEERRKERFEECVVPNCTQCGPNALSRRPPQNSMRTRGLLSQPAQTARRRSSSTERLHPRTTSYINQPPLKYGVSGIPQYLQHTYPPPYPSPPQERHPMRSEPEYSNFYPPYSTRHPGLEVLPSGQLSPMQTSPAYGMARPPASHIIRTPPYEHPGLPKSRRTSPTRARKPMVIIQQSPQMPSARYPGPIVTTYHSHYSDSSESELSDDEDRDYALMPPLISRERVQSSDSGYRSASRHEQRDKLLGRHHSRRLSISRDEPGRQDGLLLETRRKPAFEAEATHRRDSESQKSRRHSITQPNDSSETLRDRAEEREWLRFQRKGEKRREEEVKEKREHERTEREQRKNLKQAKNGRRHHEQKERAAEAPATQKFGENVQHQIPKSGDARLPKLLTSPRTEPVREPLLLLEQSQKLSTPPLAPKTKPDKRFQDILDRNANLQSPEYTGGSVEPQQLLSSLGETNEDIRKTSEPPRNLQSNPTSPIILPQTEKRVQTNKYECDVSTRLKSTTILPKTSPIAPLLTLSNEPTPGPKNDNGDLGSQSTKPVERLKVAEKLTNITPLERMEQLESPSFPSNTLTGITTCATGDDTYGVQAIAGPAKELVLLSKSNTSSGSVVSSVVDSFTASDRPISRPESSGDSSASNTEEENRFVEIDGESDEASGDSRVHVKSALDTAMNVVKGLLLRELMDHALPEAADVLEGSGTSSSGSPAGSASSSASLSLSSRTSNSQTPQRKKRMRGNGRDPGDGDGDGSDSDDRPKKKSEKGSPNRLPQRRLKCPFYQRQPEKYTKAACRGEGFADMAKLKDHIKRVHTQPLRCSRCWLRMESEEAYSHHIQKEDICNKEAEPQDDRVRPQMLKRLDFKKAPYANARNVEEKWNILFSVLFPNDTNIPSPYGQQGMSPRLERALSEALEEELTRELAPVLEPIMSRIKELIPTIIENCRLKLMHPSSSSDDETVFTPSVVSSGIGSSDSEPRSLRKQPKHRCSPTASRCSGSSFEVVPAPEILSSKAQGKLPQRPALSKTATSVEGQQEALSPDSNTDFSMFFPDALSETPNLYGSNIDDSFDMGDNGALLRLPGSFPSDGIPHATEGTSTVSANTRGISFEPYDFVEGLSQQSSAYFPDSQSSTWLLPGAGWDSGSKQTGNTGIIREQEPPPKWDLWIKNIEHSHLPNHQ